MCLGIPGRVVGSPDDADVGPVEVAGVVRDINLSLLDGPFAPGEYVLIHSGFAIERMSAQRAADSLAFFGADL
ncbi:HypC/HybG/HupF family hydrogenase formation chaperone [Kribbella sp. NBC_00482]|uniref:HypC/HybG/HupF family hydrogenase formation chaperone n=1 Tax=Kribbella sp. NBC_00482 TaxID=2975968 RepID=UPI002E194151